MRQNEDEVKLTINLVSNYHGLTKIHVVWAYPPSTFINPVSRGHIFTKSHPCLSDYNLGSIKDTDLINTAIDRHLIDLSEKVH